MQEIALLLSSLAGIATAAAVRARAGGSGQILTLGASSQIQSQIKTLRMEKEVLAKTITRLYQAEWEMPREQKEGLLARYQRQMGVVMARLEKMEDAKRHPDLGPVGDGLITLMDQKLSGLDAKIYDISSAVADIKAVQQKAMAPGKAAAAQGAGSAEGAVTAAAAAAIPAEADAKPVLDVPIPGQKRVRPFEITTLTSISATKKPEFKIKADEKADEKRAAKAAEQQAAIETPVTPKQEQLPVEKPAVVQKGDLPEKESAAVEVVEEEKKKMPDVSSLIIPDVGTAAMPETASDTAGTKDAAADKPKPATLPSPTAAVTAAIAGGKVTPPKQDEGEAARLVGDGGDVQSGGIDVGDGGDGEEDDKELEEAISDIKKTLEKLDRAESE